MKNVILVSKQGNAVAVGDNNMAPVSKSAVGTFSASLEVLKQIMSSIPTEVAETTHIHLPDTMQGIVSGSAIEYVKTGKTTSGNALTPEEVKSFREFYDIYKERILNVRFSLVKYIRKDANDLKALVAKAWDTLNSMSAVTATVKQIVIDPNKELREALDKQIIEAMKNGNMEMFKTLTEYRATLTAPVVTATSAVRPGDVVPTPKFGDEADNAFNNAGVEKSGEEETAPVDENGQPLQFTEPSEPGEQQVAW